MKAIILGATGFIGRNLINFLKRKNFEIFVVSRNPKKLKGEEIPRY